MKAVLRAKEFKRLIDNTKKFVGSTKLMQYIYIEIDSETKKIKATALDGHRVSIECADLFEVDETFKCFVKPNIPTIKNIEYVELELKDKRLLITAGENIYGYVQPEGTYFDIGKVIKDCESSEIKATVAINANYLKEAMQFIPNNKFHCKPVVKIEVRSEKDPLVIRSGKDSFKIILPVNNVRFE